MLTRMEQDAYNAQIGIARSLYKIAKELKYANALKIIEIERSFANYHNDLETAYKDFEKIKEEYYAEKTTG